MDIYVNGENRDITEANLVLISGFDFIIITFPTYLES